jgi:RNA polymerase sigma-70 factor (sigma-E family)
MGVRVTDDETPLGELLQRPAHAEAQARRAVVPFDQWVASNSQRLLRFAYVITGSQSAAEETLQSTLAKAYEKWERISSVENPVSYVRRMIVNAHISWWRRIGRRQDGSASSTDDNVGMIDLAAPDFTDQITLSELVWQCCLELPPMQRAAVVLRFYEDLTYAEIAAILKCPEATARSRVHRGLVALRLAIEDEEDRDD